MASSTFHTFHFLIGNRLLGVCELSRRKGRCLDDKFGPYAKECPDGRDAGHQGHGRLFKEARNPSNGSRRFKGDICRWKGTCLKIEFSKMLLSSGLY